MTLSVPDVLLDKDPISGEYTWITDGGELESYNPQNPFFGNSYTLTDPRGMRYSIDATTGKLVSETDRNGNTLTFQEDGIFSSAGRSVTFQRDQYGRITAITDPSGNSILYGYDAAG